MKERECIPPADGLHRLLLLLAAPSCSSRSSRSFWRSCFGSEPSSIDRQAVSLVLGETTLEIYTHVSTHVGGAGHCGACVTAVRTRNVCRVSWHVRVPVRPGSDIVPV